MTGMARPTWPGSLARRCRFCRVRAARRSIRSLVGDDFAITDPLDDSRAPDRLQRKSQRRPSLSYARIRKLAMNFMNQIIIF
jgi:hypothetical protein